jgi:PAS domain S-box-containing protein
MRVQSKIWISIAASLAVSAVIAYFAFSLMRQMSHDFAQYRGYSEIINKAFALDILIDDALKTESKARTMQQIGQVRGALSKTLESISSSNSREESLIRQIRRNNLELGPLIDQLFDSGGGSNDSIDTERRNFLASQLWIKVRFITDDVNRLMQTSGTRIVSAQAQASLIVLILIGIAILAKSSIYFFSSRSIVKAQEALRESEERFRAFMDNSPTIGWAKNEAGQYVYFSKTYENRFGVRLEDWRGKTDFELWPREIAEEFRKNDLAVLEDDQSIKVQEKTINPDGSICWWWNFKFPFQDAAGGRNVGGIGVDITERKRAEEKINYLASFPLINPNPVLEVDEGGQILFANPSAWQAVEQLSLPEGIKAFVPPDIQEWFIAARQGGKREYAVDLSLADHFYSVSVFIPPEQFTARLYVMDITERQRGELERQRLVEQLQRSEEELQAQNAELQAANLEIVKAHRTLRESREDLNRAQAVAHTGSWRMDVQHNVLSWSDENHRIFGIARGTPMSYQTFLGTIHPEDRDFVDRNWMAALHGEHYDLEHRIVVGDTVKWVREQAELEFDPQGNLLGGFGTTQDITERKRYEETIKSSLREKEVLLQEIHHRTKNNLNVVCALLSLQSAQHDNEVVQLAFQEMENRIRSMALVHEKLYRAKDLSNIDLGEYIQDLAVSIMANYRLLQERISLLIKVASLTVNIETAMPCGLIINELISNAMKYAFPEEREGTINITLQTTQDGKIDLRVADDGVGLPPDVDIRNTESLGMQLITSLAENQLKGDMELHLEQGTEFRLRFQEQDYE